MILLSEKTFDRFTRAIKYPSITGGRGVSVKRQPGGGVNIEIPSTAPGGGGNLGPPYDPFNPPYDPDHPSVTAPGSDIPWQPPPAYPLDPFAPDLPS